MALRRLWKSLVQYDMSEVGSFPTTSWCCTSISIKVLPALSSLGVPGEGEYPSGYGREETDGSDMIVNLTTTTAWSLTTNQPLYLSSIVKD